MRKKWLALALPLALILGLSTAATAQVERLTLAASGVPTQDLGDLPEGSFVQDPSFEAGSPNPVWTEFSSNFGTPLCTELLCGLGGGTGPQSGDWWAWFGGIAAPEEGSVSQTVTLSGTDDVILSFGLEQAACSGDPADFMEVLVDGVQVFETLGNDPSCTNVGYRTVTVDISSFVNSTTIDLEFHSIINGSDVTNFFVDNVDISIGGGGAPTLSVTGTCPGDITLSLSGASAGAVAGIFRGNSAGSDAIPGGPCAGTPTGLSGLALLTTTTTDGSGGFSFTRTAPGAACGQLIQVVDTATCTVSNVAQIP